MDCSLPGSSVHGIFQARVLDWIAIAFSGSDLVGISLSNEHPGLISFRMDWLDLLAVQVTLKSLLHVDLAKQPLGNAALGALFA